MIILTDEQAAELDKQGSGNSRLEPLRINGGWALPEGVLADDMYIAQREFLSELPRAEDVVLLYDNDELITWSSQE